MTCDGTVFDSFNPFIEALPAYNSGLSINKARELSGKQDIARLASNENGYGCSPQVLELLTSGHEPWRYPDSQCTALRNALAEKLSVKPQQIVIGNGSEELISAIARAVLTEGDTVVTVTPSFGLHEIEPLAMGAKVIKVRLTEDLEFDVEALREAILAKPKLVFLSSPSNPVGCVLDQAALETLLNAVSPETLFVLDEAYYEFAAQELPDSIKLLSECGVPMVVLRTFSKAYGLAGFRVGYAVTQDERMSKCLALTRTPFSINEVAQSAAIAALADQTWMQEAVDKTVAERDRMSAELKSRGFLVSASRSNSLFVHVGMDSNALFQALVREGVIVKPWREAGYEEFIRVSAGTPKENTQFLDSLSAIITSKEAQPVPKIA